MKRLLPVAVLLFSLSAAGVYVWKSSQKDKLIPAKQEAAVDSSQGDFVEPMEPKIVVTDEEVRARREAMMSTSKSGIIMSEEDVRKMLEEQKKAAQKHHLVPALPDAEDLAPSSKNPGRSISPRELRKKIESIQQQQEQPEDNSPP